MGEGFQEAPTRSGPSGARRDACGWDRTGGCTVGPGFDGVVLTGRSYMEGRRSPAEAQGGREGRKIPKKNCISPQNVRCTCSSGTLQENWGGFVGSLGLWYNTSYLW